MNEKQPKALRLAELLDADACDLQTPREAAAELRRLHALNAELLAAAKEAEPMLKALLENIERVLPAFSRMPALEQVRAAITKAEGGAA